MHFIATVLHNRIVVRVLQRYHIITLFIRRLPHWDENASPLTHTKGGPVLPLYFYFYFVCRTSYIPGELIISVFNFLPTGLYGIVCFKREAAERFAGVPCVTRNPYVIGELQREKNSDQSRAIKTRCDLSIYALLGEIGHCSARFRRKNTSKPVALNWKT